MTGPHRPRRVASLKKVPPMRPGTPDPYRLSLRIREILYGSRLGESEKNSRLSSTYLHNELMRGCLLRRQYERLSAVFRPSWSAVIAFSFNLRFLIVLTNAYQRRRYGLA